MKPLFIILIKPLVQYLKESILLQNKVKRFFRAYKRQTLDCNKNIMLPYTST